MTVDPFSFLSSLEQFGIKFGLDNIRALTTALDHPERAYPSVHVAGTNGKGSVTAMVETALRAASLRTGRYTSPHLVSLTERFAVDGVPVSERDVADAIETIRIAIDRLMHERTLPALPTFFEVTTAIAFELFRRAHVDIAICEVGLGGRLDATNVLQPAVTAITSIGHDHEKYLGTTLESIAAEKAGIIKTGVPVVVGPLPGAAMAVVRQRATECGAPLVEAASGLQVETADVRPGTTTFPLRTPRRDYGRIALGLHGRHQVGNAVVAVRVLESLEDQGFAIGAQAIRDGLERVVWRGRLEQVTFGDGRVLLMDAAHNPEGADALAAFLALDAPRPLVFAAMNDKDVAGILGRLLPAISAIVITRASNPRSAPIERIADIVRALAPALPLTTADAPGDALAEAWRLDRSIVAAGSIFLLGDIIEATQRS